MYLGFSQMESSAERYIQSYGIDIDCALNME